MHIPFIINSICKQGKMARRPRLFGEKLYHHIYAWGNNRQAIFITDQHYARYLDFLEKYSKDYRVDVIAYALMQTHTHLFVYDLHGKVSQFMNSLHGEYAQYFNYVTGRVGHVFGERFNNKIVQANVYGLWLSRYIHRQAVEAGIVADPRHYPRTSYHIYLGEVLSGFVKPDVVLEQFGDEQGRGKRYEAFILDTENGPIDWEVKSVAVVGDEEFQRELHECETPVGKEDISDKQIYELVTTHFKINPRLLYAPHGWEEKRLRTKIIARLVEEVGLKPLRVARLCRISPCTVHRVLNKKAKNVMPVPD
jgi:REP element-mobilizing transposase RayT